MEVPFLEERLTVSDGSALRIRRWEGIANPVQTQCSQVLIVHGWGDCSERHRHVAEAFAMAGFGGVLYDLRGHGLSEGRRGDFRCYSEMTADFNAVLAAVAAGEKSVIVAAFSFGAQIAVNAINTSRPKCVAAVALTSPWFRLSVRAPVFKLALAHIARVFAPGLVQKTPLTGGDLSTDKKWLEELERRAQGQPHRYISTRTYFAAVENGLRALASAGTPDALMRLPVFTAHGTKDTVTDATATREFISSYCGVRKTHRDYAGWRHELQNEIGRAEFLDDLTGWAREISSAQD